MAAGETTHIPAAPGGDLPSAARRQERVHTEHAPDGLGSGLRERERRPRPRCFSGVTVQQHLHDQTVHAKLRASTYSFGKKEEVLLDKKGDAMPRFVADAGAQNLPVPVADLHGDQVIDHWLCVLGKAGNKRAEKESVRRR